MDHNNLNGESAQAPFEQVPIFKADPVTDSERYLERLCRRTFLSLWSYVGVFRDQGRGEFGGDGKEVTDLLVIFGNNVIVFSDKTCAYPLAETNTAWSRWFKKTVLKAANQIYGAERWIRYAPDKLFLDRKCTQPFPLQLALSEELRFYRVVVAHGASEACRAHFGYGH